MTAETHLENMDGEGCQEPIEPGSSIEPGEVMTLSARDSRRIAEALLNSPEPTSDMVEAVRRYRDLTAG